MKYEEQIRSFFVDVLNEFQKYVYIPDLETITKISTLDQQSCQIHFQNKHFGINIGVTRELIYQQSDDLLIELATSELEPPRGYIELSLGEIKEYCIDTDFEQVTHCIQPSGKNILYKGQNIQKAIRVLAQETAPENNRVTSAVYKTLILPVFSKNE